MKYFQFASISLLLLLAWTGKSESIAGIAAATQIWNKTLNSSKTNQSFPTFPVHSSQCRLALLRSRRLRRLCRRLLVGRVAPPTQTGGRSRNLTEILIRRRRSGYDYADYYDWNQDADLMDYENPDSDLSILEKMNKRGRKVVLAAVVGLNVGMCCFCSFCLFICKAISNDYQARKENCVTFYDHICCRDHAYRPVVKFFKSLDLRPPTYNEFKRMREGYKNTFGE